MHNFNLNIETATLFSGLPFSLGIHITHTLDTVMILLVIAIYLWA